MSINKESAERKVQEHINSIYKSIEIERELVIVKTIPYEDEGWIIYFDTKKSIETGNWKDGLTGNYPIFIFQDNGKMYSIHPSTDETKIVQRHRKENPLPATTVHYPQPMVA
jgi:hypothetical protein